MSFSDPNAPDIIRGLVPVSFHLDEATPRLGPYPLARDRYDDYVWLEFRRADGLGPDQLVQTIIDTLTSVLQDMHNLEVPQELALKSSGFRVVIARGLHEQPREMDLGIHFRSAAGSQQQQQAQNARLADWVWWGIKQRDPAKFRFVVYPITPQ
ncbi:hypothetical protein PG993_008459 [Apiospora rasikravindrae]|uniref:Uncharacterized protein n=1 Tax=Apiospora rasikravindrae TaxID=990691 RepID=A0ABR1T0E5_9PEZI